MHYLGFHEISTVVGESLLKQLHDKKFIAILLNITDEASIAKCRDEVENMVEGRLDVEWPFDSENGGCWGFLN